MKFAKKFLAVAALLAATHGAASAAPFSYTGAGANNVDSASTTSVSLNILDGGLITDLNVYVNILGGYTGNNNVWLTHDGITVRLFNSPGTSGSAQGNMAITFDDAAVAMSVAPPFSGTFRPVDSLGAFNGATLAGLWTLNIRDVTVYPGEGDRLASWSLSGTVPEPGSLALVGLGLAAAAGLRARSKKSA